MDARAIGNKITQARKSVSLSQAQIAQQLFISPQAVGKWERGESLPDIIMLDRLAKITGVDLNYFVVERQTTAVVTNENPVKDDQPSGRKGKRDMSRSNWVNANFSELRDLSGKFNLSNIENCLFQRSDLSGLILENNRIDGSDFSGSDMSNCKIGNSHLSGNSFEDADLTEATFYGSHIVNCDFTKAKMNGTSFISCSFSKNQLFQTLLSELSFQDSAISNLVFEGKMENCSFQNCGFHKVQMRNTTLKNCFFKGKLKGIEFVDCRADRLTYEFLKAGKANMEGLAVT